MVLAPFRRCTWPQLAQRFAGLQQRADHHAGADVPGVKIPDTLNPGVADPPGRDIGPAQRKVQMLADSVILANLTIFWYLALKVL